MTPDQLKTRHVGKQDPKRHLENAVEKAMGDQASTPTRRGTLMRLTAFCTGCAKFRNDAPGRAMINRCILYSQR